MCAKTIEPNGVARLSVKRDLRLFALSYNDLIVLVKERKMLVDLLMIKGPSLDQPSGETSYRAHVHDAGGRVDALLAEVEKRYKIDLDPNCVVEVFRATEIRLVRLSLMTQSMKEYVLEPGDVVIVRTVSDI